jgi:hypothetical protein
MGNHQPLGIFNSLTIWYHLINLKKGGMASQTCLYLLNMWLDRRIRGLSYQT